MGGSGSESRRRREGVSTPSLFPPSTNYCSVRFQYEQCQPLPQLWRLEVLLGQELYRQLTDPSLFFRHWLEAEGLRQGRDRDRCRRDRDSRKRKGKISRRQARAAPPPLIPPPSPPITTDTDPFPPHSPSPCPTDPPATETKSAPPAEEHRGRKQEQAATVETKRGLEPPTDSDPLS
jgi:hypothetical protein